MTFRCGAAAVLSLLFVLFSQAPARAQDEDGSGLDAGTLASLREAAALGDRAGVIAAVARAVADRPDRAADIVAEAARLSPQYRDAIVAVASVQLPESEAEFREAADPAPRVAETAPTIPEASPWSGEASFGGALATGNTEHSSLAAGARVEYASAPWVHKLDLAFEFARDNEETSAQRLATSFQSNYDVNERSYVFGFVGYEDDEFSGFDYVVTEAAGLGYRLIETDTMTFSLEAGPGYRFSKRADTGEVEDELVGRFAANFAWELSETAKLTNDTAVVQGVERRTVENTTAVTTDLFGDLDGRLSFNVRHDSDPPAGAEETDTLTKASLVYDF